MDFVSVCFMFCDGTEFMMDEYSDNHLGRLTQFVIRWWEDDYLKVGFL